MTSSSKRSEPRNPRSRMHILVPQLAAFLLLSLSLSLHAGTIFPSTPTHNGKDTFVLRFKTVTKTVVVNVTKGMTKLEKAMAIQLQMKNMGIAAFVTPGGNVRVPNTNSIKWLSGSGERKDSVGEPGLIPGRSGRAKIDLHDQPTYMDLAGVDSDGNAASYTAGFDFSSPSLGNISLSTSLGFSNLTTPTLTGLLQQEFGLLLSQLQIQAPSLASSLALNLSDDAIVFQPSGIFTNLSATNGTTDIALVASLHESTSVPEPSSLLMMGSGLLIGMGWYARKRRTKPTDR